MFSKFRKKAKNVNHLEDIFDLAERVKSPTQEKEGKDASFSRMKKELEECYPSNSENKALSFKQIDEFSPFLAYYIKNDILKDVSRKILESDFDDSTKLRHCEKMNKKILYVNLNKMAPIDENIQVMDKNGCVLKLSETYQGVFNGVVEKEYNGKKMAIDASIVFGVLKE